LFRPPTFDSDGRERSRCQTSTKAVGTQQDAQWYSYSANQTHGLRRTNADKAKAVKAALAHPNGAKMSDGAIAEHVGVSQPFVGKHRAAINPTHNGYQSPARTGRDGRTINTAGIGKAALAKALADVDGEYAENVIRKDFTASERDAIRKAIEAHIEVRKGGKKGGATRSRHMATSRMEPTEGEKTDVFSAKKAGFSSEMTARRVRGVIEKGCSGGRQGARVLRRRGGAAKVGGTEAWRT
jgi:hypothetical protein